MQVIDFLEARIAEDEEAAQRGVFTSVLQPLYEGGQLFQRTVEIPPAVKIRVLAECEAKRRIIALCRRAAAAAVPGTGAMPGSAPAGGYAERLLVILAQIYKQHPDFCADWALED